MKVVIVTKEATDYARAVTDWLRDFERQTGRTIEVIDPDSRAGTDFARTYDIVQYPTLIALSDDGRIQQTWVGTILPTISEVSYYAQ